MDVMETLKDRIAYLEEELQLERNRKIEVVNSGVMTCTKGSQATAVCFLSQNSFGRNS